MDKELAILEQDGLFAVGVFTTAGLYATCLPRKNREEAIDTVDGKELLINNTPPRLSILRLVHDINNGMKVNLNHINFDFSGLSENHVKVLNVTLKISYGTTMPYGEVAELAGLHRAARFVGNVMSNNRFCPVVPCHRVVGSTSLGGYGGRLDIKKRLLKAERAYAD